jgi:hypothetical protein
LGYLSIDVMNPPKGTVWGHFNDRQVDGGQVEKLLVKYKTNVDNCTSSTAMRVAVKSAWVTNLSAAMANVMGKTIDEVPMLEFTPEALAEFADDDVNHGLWMLSGNHRRIALRKHLEVVETDLATLQENHAAVEERIRVEGFKKEVEDERIKLEEDILQREQTIAMSSRWAVEVYNRGACGRTRRVRLHDVLIDDWGHWGLGQTLSTRSTRTSGWRSTSGYLRTTTRLFT